MAVESNRDPEVAGRLVGGVGETSDAAYRIDHVEAMAPFLMTVVSYSDLWMFVSSTGALTAGRVDADHTVFPYETDDRIHRGAGQTGPVTLIARSTDEGREVWQPFAPIPTAGCTRAIEKSVLGDRIVFEETHPRWGLTHRATWEPSDRFGWIRTTELVAETDAEVFDVDVLDGLLDVMPSGIDALTEQIRSNLADAYKRAETDPTSSLAVYALESAISDRAEPLESLTATCAWSWGFDGAELHLDGDAVGAMRTARPTSPSTLVTGRPGAYLLHGDVAVRPGEPRRWAIAVDTALDHARVADLAAAIASPDTPGSVADDVAAGHRRLRALLAGADAFQHTGDPLADAHHLSNVLFNCMRGGVFPFAGEVPVADLARFVAEHDRDVATRHGLWFDGLGDRIDERALRAAADDAGDPDLVRLVLEYLPLTFSRRHGDPSRPWNRFSIHVRDEDGDPLLSYEGNWRDIFQNWEALLQSYPMYFPNVVAKFLDATTIEGYNPYRISRSGIDWEVPDPDDPWSHIGYWGDHQIVYLMRLLEMWERYEPGALADWSDRHVFVFADVPYALAPHDRIVADPRNTIDFDHDRAARIAQREERIGADGRLLVDADGDIVRVGMIEKLLVPALAKLSNHVPDGGIWLNTQRPEWNDANNALAGPGLSMVTLYHLRRYLGLLSATVAGSPGDTLRLTDSVARWLADLRDVFTAHPARRLDDTERRTVVDRLGRSAQAHRERVRDAGPGPFVEVPATTIADLCTSASAHLDASIAGARRDDGLYHSYNRISFDSDVTARVDHLGPMLEGQVAVLSSGALSTDECLSVVDALFSSAMFRPDLGTFLLYPPAELVAFSERNAVSADAERHLATVRPAVTDAVTVIDAGGRRRFRSTVVNAKALDQALDDAGATAHERTALLVVHEAVFDHRSFTGRSGRMHGYEGIGSVYWHMVAKLLVALQERYWDAVETGDSEHDLARLAAAYQRVRSGFGFLAPPSVFGAIPTDCYSHTPAHGGAQQPGMTGQVKEEILTRFGELGLHVDDGRLSLIPGLLDPSEVIPDAGEHRSAASAVCGIPVHIDVGATDGVVVERDGTSESFDGLEVPSEVAAQVFGRTGDVIGLRWSVGADTLDRWRRIAGGGVD